MQNLISILYMAVAMTIFYAGYRTGRQDTQDTQEHPKKDSSFFMPLPTLPKMEDKPKKAQEKEDDSNKFYK